MNPDVLGENNPPNASSGASRTKIRDWTSGSQLLTLRGSPRGRPNAGSIDWNFWRNGNGRGERLRLGDLFPLSLVFGRTGLVDGRFRQPIDGACARPRAGDRARCMASSRSALVTWGSEHLRPVETNHSRGAGFDEAPLKRRERKSVS